MSAIRTRSDIHETFVDHLSAMSISAQRTPGFRHHYTLDVNGKPVTVQVHAAEQARSFYTPADAPESFAHAGADLVALLDQRGLHFTPARAAAHASLSAPNETHLDVHLRTVPSEACFATPQEALAAA